MLSSSYNTLYCNQFCSSYGPLAAATIAADAAAIATDDKLKICKQKLCEFDIKKYCLKNYSIIFPSTLYRKKQHCNNNDNDKQIKPITANTYKEKKRRGKKIKYCQPALKQHATAVITIKKAKKPTAPHKPSEIYLKTSKQTDRQTDLDRQKQQQTKKKKEKKKQMLLL